MEYKVKNIEVKPIVGGNSIIVLANSIRVFKTAWELL